MKAAPQHFCLPLSLLQFFQLEIVRNYKIMTGNIVCRQRCTLLFILNDNGTTEVVGR